MFTVPEGASTAVVMLVGSNMRPNDRRTSPTRGRLRGDGTLGTRQSGGSGRSVCSKSRKGANQ